MLLTAQLSGTSARGTQTATPASVDPSQAVRPKVKSKRSIRIDDRKQSEENPAQGVNIDEGKQSEENPTQGVNIDEGKQSEENPAQGVNIDDGKQSEENPDPAQYDRHSHRETP
eukprot:1087913-Prorocentrum_minimum.AAC.2